ncbi:Aste57867_24088 [Aphanomyces stellatus]|uniref:Aste57867_24088 protein n=1 Tax=Aphanomyces stellatus TaxID=120398 RepID=A0A485LPG5_9STRA|nr:hypothetical protein As57867_024015 [Aphanomyces stellatus]VFU00730.1 Aste57867_24088 [Aphanomyces stellatus]
MTFRVARSFLRSEAPPLGFMTTTTPAAYAYLELGDGPRSPNCSSHSSIFLPARVHAWRFQMGLIYLAQFTAEASRGLVLPTLFLYCQALGGGLADMGRATSIFSVGRVLSSILFGYMSDHVSFRAVHLLSAAIGVMGNLVYLVPTSPHLSPMASMALLLLSRFLVGFGAGNVSVCRANVATMTPVAHRLQYMNRLALVVFLGYALSPGLGGLFAHVDVPLPGSLALNALSIPGLLLALLNAITFVSVLFGFDNSLDAMDAPPATLSPSSPWPSIEATPRKPSSSVPLPPSTLPDHTLVGYGIALFILLNIVGRGVLAVFETILVPLHFQVAHESVASAMLSIAPGTISAAAVQAAATFQFNIGLLGLVTYLVVEISRHAIAHTAWLVLGLAAYVVGNTLLLVPPLHWTQFCVAIYFVWSVGAPLLTAVSVAAFSTLLGTRPQGLWMGIFGAAGSLSRIVLPLIPALFLTLTPMFWINLGLSATGIALLAVYTFVSGRHQRVRGNAVG